MIFAQPSIDENRVHKDMGLGSKVMGIIPNIDQIEKRQTTGFNDDSNIDQWNNMFTKM